MGRSSFPLKVFAASISTAVLALAVADIASVLLATPLADIRSQLRAVLIATVAALGVALTGAAVIALIVSHRVGERVRSIAALGARYRHGDLTRAKVDFGDDELGTVARGFDDAIQELGRRFEELARDRARMEAVLAGMIEGVIVVDPAGLVRLANQAAMEMLKLDARTVDRHYVETIRHPAIADLLGKALAGATPPAAELSPPRDPSRTIIARATPTGGGALHGVVLVLHDITELRRADRIRRDFVANVSHELRTPLTAIRGYVEALADGDVSADEQQRFLEVIMRQTRGMERLVQDLLRLARLDARQEAIELRDVDTAALISGVTGDLAAATEARRQRIQVIVDGGAERLRGDGVKLHDAMRNLVSNASTYAPEGSTIEIRATRVGRQVRLAVADQGPGIPEADLTRIFERFYRVDKSRGRDPGGTGLGLAIAKHLVELHGGRLTAENRPTGGALFTMDLPN